MELITCKTTSDEDSRLLRAAVETIQDMIDAVDVIDEELEVPSHRDIERAARDMIDTMLRILGIEK